MAAQSNGKLISYSFGFVFVVVDDDRSALLLRHRFPLTAQFTQNVLLVKNENERLGMHIKGGLHGQRGNPLDPADEGVFISKINSSGAARRDGRLKVR